MRIAVMQPAYLPWMGFFDLIDQVDTFVLLDDVQFEKQSWQQRNFVKGPNGKVLLSVPVQRTGLQTLICEICINAQTQWQEKHLQSILQCYAKAPFLSERRTWLHELYSKQWKSLFELNSTIIMDVCSILGMKTPIVRSSELSVRGSKVERLLQICKSIGADTYLSPVGAFDYIEKDNRFMEHSITLEYQHFVHPTYRQLHGDFVSHLSAIDLFLNEGSDSVEILRSGRKTLLTHEEVAANLAKITG